MPSRDSTSISGFWSRTARSGAILSATSGFVLAMSFMAMPASAAPADPGVFVNPAHVHGAVAHPTTTATVKAAPAVPATAPAHTFHPVAGAPDEPQDPGHLTSGTCYSTPSGICTLRAAVMEADAEGSYIAIALTSGTYPLTIPPTGTTDASTGNLDITDPATVTFTGAGMGNTTIDATGMGDRIFQLENNAVARMTGFTIENGNTSGFGGGINIASTAAALVLQSMRITSNTAELAGGGIFAQGSLWATGSQLTDNTTPGSGGGLLEDGSAQLVNDTITGNTARYLGGGVDVTGGPTAFQGGSVSDNHLVFPNNTRAQGGGVWIGEATTMVGTTISNNTIAPDSTATSGTARGGGLFIQYGLNNADHLTVHGNTVSGFLPDASCFGDSGGGIVDNAGVTLTNSVVSGNKALDGDGGGLCNNGNVEQLTHVTVAGNTAGTDGGGVYGFDVTYIRNSTITGNSAVRDGGGFFGDDGEQIDQTLIANNHAVQGAGIFNEFEMLMTNDTLTGNVASGTGNAGGAIYHSANSSSSGTTMQLTNVTISGNRSDDGGGIAQFGNGFSLNNTIIAWNRANSTSADTNCEVSNGGATPLTDVGNNIDSGHTCGLNGPSSRSNTNPKLGALANNGGPTKTMALLSGSPAINAGSSPAPTVDQRGFKRDSRPDIGAFEKQ